MKQRVKLSVNKSLLNKPSSDDLGTKSTKGWRPSEVNVDVLAELVVAGYAFAPQYRDQYRKGSNFLCAGFVAADCDEGMSIDEARDHPFINSYASLIYTTASHTDAHHRFRIVFATERVVEDASAWADAQLALAYRLRTDLNVTDKARCFFGNQNAQIWKFGNILPSEVLDDLIQSGRELRQAKSEGFAVNSAKRIDPSIMVTLADGSTVPLTDVEIGTSVHCPNHDDRRPSAFIVPSWTRGGIGIHCRACGLTYWQQAVEEYDFSAFEKMVEQRVKNPLASFEPKTLIEEFFPPNSDCFITQDRFLARIEYEPGITLIKSDKGTGKTTVMGRLVADVRAQRFPGIPVKDRPKSVLLVGHRRALLRATAAKLDLSYYLEVGRVMANPTYFAVCLDSLPNFTEPFIYAINGSRPLFKQDDAFDLVIIDESEQVFRHLVGGTIEKKRGALERCYDALHYQITKAKAVIALDADLSMLTAHALRYLRPADWQFRTRIFWNKPVVAEQTKSVSLYASEIALRENMLAAINRGERCFVTCNSKKSVKVLAKIIRERCGSAIKMRTITSDNSCDPDEIEFVKNISDEFPKIQVLNCSPSLGTGIDITCKVENVYGFFYAKVNTHTDMDQQLARVRNPGSIKVWISPARHHYSSNFDVIRDDLARARYVPGAVKGYSDDGHTIYDSDHPLLMICTHVTASQRASKNKLIELFCELRQANGWTIEHDDSRIIGNKDRSAAEKKLWTEHVHALLKAPRVADDEYLDLCIRRESKDPLTFAERLCFERNTLERSLGVELTYDIIKLNHDGRLPDRVELLSDLANQWPHRREQVQGLVVELEKPLSRLPKSKGPLLLQFVATVAGLSGTDNLRADALVTAESLASFANLCVRNRTVVEELLGLPVRADVVQNPIRQLNAFLTKAGLKLEAIKRRKKSKKSVREYGFPRERFELMMSLAHGFKSPDAVRQNIEEQPSPGASTPIFDLKYPPQSTVPITAL